MRKYSLLEVAPLRKRAPRTRTLYLQISSWDVTGLAQTRLYFFRYFHFGEVAIEVRTHVIGGYLSLEGLCYVEKAQRKMLDDKKIDQMSNVQDDWLWWYDSDIVLSRIPLGRLF